MSGIVSPDICHDWIAQFILLETGLLEDGINNKNDSTERRNREREGTEQSLKTLH